MLRKIQSYEILERIGMGGMGIVYKARHSFRNEVVAIKSLSPQYCHDPQIRERFIHEAEILNKLNHPNIVKVVDFVQEVDELHLVMQFVEGKTLDKIIGTEVGPIPFEQALPLFKQILNGIAYAHKNGVIHRDLKPSNIIVHNGNVVITDFGIAKITGNAGFTKTGTKLGTLYYMSPEQIRGEHVTEQSDIYSLGMTLYEMLAGRLPYDKSSDTSEFNLMNQIVNQELPDPRKFYPAIPEWLVSIIKKAITKDKKDRIKSCQEFIELLENEPKKIEVKRTTEEIKYKKPATTVKEPAKYEKGEDLPVKATEPVKEVYGKTKKKIIFWTVIFLIVSIPMIILINTINFSKELVGAEEISTLTGHSDWVNSVSFSPDSKYIASGSSDKTIKLWNVDTGEETKTLIGHKLEIKTVSFSPDGRYLVSGGWDNTVKLWNVKTGKEISTLTGHNDCVFSVSFSPDGKFIASGSSDKTIILWDVETGDIIKTLIGVNSINVIAFLPDGEYLASGDYKAIRLWNVKTAKVIKTLTEQSLISSLSYSPDGQYLASGSWDRSIKLWDMETEEEIKTILAYDAVLSIAFSPNGKYLASGLLNDTIKLWDIETGEEIKTLKSHLDGRLGVNSVSFSPDGKYLASGSDDKTIKIWKLIYE